VKPACSVDRRHVQFAARACHVGGQRGENRRLPTVTSQIVFCGDKGIIDADYLIDDRARHFERFKGHPLLFSAPHNAAESRYPRVDSWKDVREVFARLDRRKGPVWQSRGVEEPAAAAS
jgi:hypothetical protein